MKYFVKILIIVFFFLQPIAVTHAQSQANKNARHFTKDLLSDIRNFYTLRNLTTWSIALSGSALFSFTPIDKTIKDTYQESIRGPRSDAISRVVKPLGKWQYTFPLYVGCSLFDYFQWENQPVFMHTIGNWGSRSSRALFVGFPSVVIFQRVIGSPRPATDNSRWQPFRNASGVSGHAFVGAVPFLSAGSMTKNPWLKGILITASTAPAISRINDNGHYMSQIVLGWLAAWLSVRAVSRTKNAHNGTGLQVFFSGNRINLAFSF